MRLAATMRHRKSHDTEIHFVIIHKVKRDEFEIDYDGTQYWIRSLFEPNSQTWCNDCGEYVKDSQAKIYTTQNKLNDLFGRRHND